MDHVFNVISIIYLSYFKFFPCLYPVQWEKTLLMCPRSVSCICRAPCCGRDAAGVLRALGGSQGSCNSSLSVQGHGISANGSSGLRRTADVLLKSHLNHDQEMQALLLCATTQPHCREELQGCGGGSITSDVLPYCPPATNLPETKDLNHKILTRSINSP